MTDRYCLFCDKELKEREIFIQGMNPLALICNVCIGICCEIVFKRLKDNGLKGLGALDSGQVNTRFMVDLDDDQLPR
jgi:hypothetical protein